MASRNSFDAATSTPLSVAAIQVLRAQGVDGAPADPLGGSSRLAQLLTQMEKLLAERYAFDVFAKDWVPDVSFNDNEVYSNGKEIWEWPEPMVGQIDELWIDGVKKARRDVRRIEIKFNKKSVFEKNTCR